MERVGTCCCKQQGTTITTVASYKSAEEVQTSPSGEIRGGFNGRPLVQWPTRPLGGWALEAPGPRGPRKAKFWLAIAKS